MSAGVAQQSVDQYVGARLRQLRETRGMDLSDVAACTGTTERLLGSYERGERRPLPADIIAMAELYGVTLRDLFPEDAGQLTGRLN